MSPSTSAIRIDQKSYDSWCYLTFVVWLGYGTFPMFLFLLSKLTKKHEPFKKPKSVQCYSVIQWITQFLKIPERAAHVGLALPLHVDPVWASVVALKKLARFRDAKLRLWESKTIELIWCRYSLELKSLKIVNSFALRIFWMARKNL